MNVNPTQTTTSLRTGLLFEVYDFRGRDGWPEGQGGLVFNHFERRTIRCKFTGLPIERDERYVVRTDDTGKGWRVDRLPGFGPAETIYGPDRADYFPTNHEAAAALAWALDEIRDDSSLG